MKESIAVTISKEIARMNYALENMKERARIYDDAEENMHKKLENLPSGSGFDDGCFLLLHESTPEKLVFRANFHHMNNDGLYIGWSSHKVIVTASLQYGFNIKVTGRDKRGIKDYIVDSFSFLTEGVES